MFGQRPWCLGNNYLIVYSCCFCEKIHISVNISVKINQGFGKKKLFYHRCFEYLHYNTQHYDNIIPQLNNFVWGLYFIDGSQIKVLIYLNEIHVIRIDEYKTQIW